MIKWFKDTSIHDVSLVGGKTASLGEMYRSLTPKGINVPNGFGITADAYWMFVRENNLESVIKSAFADMSSSSSVTLQDTGRKIRSTFLEAEIPESVKKDILDAYQKMVRSDLATSAVMFSIDTESGFDNVVLINAAYGHQATREEGASQRDKQYFRSIINEIVCQSLTPNIRCP